MKYYTFAVACALSLALGTQAFAAPVPSTAEPGRSSEDIQKQKPKARATGESVIPLRPGSMAPEESQRVTFVLHGIKLVGAASISESELSSEWSAYVDQTISVAKLYEIVTAISARYAAAGYALSFALLPEQDITNGQVNIVVVEGYVDNVVVNSDVPEGGRLGLARQIEAQSARIKASRPLRVAALERSLLLLNDLPGVKARAVFSASKSAQNASTLTLEVERDRISASADVNNRMTKDLGEWRAGGSVSLNGVATGTDRLTFSAYSAVDADGFKYGSARYEQVLNTDGLTLALGGSYSNDVPLKGILKAIDFKGNNSTGSLDVTWPLIRSRPENLTLGAGFLYNDTKTEALGVSLTEDKVRSLNVSLTHDFYDSTGGINLIRADLTRGLSILDATKDSSLLKSRANGSANFTTLSLYASRVQPLLDRISLFAEVQMQAALGNSLLAVRECAFGGQSFGRAYDAGALSGDHCLESSAEARYDSQLSGIGFQVYSYIDAAFIAQKGILEPGEKRHEQASSTGGGIRMFVSTRATVGAEIAVPLRDRFTDKGDGDTRVFFSSTIKF